MRTIREMIGNDEKVRHFPSVRLLSSTMQRALSLSTLMKIIVRRSTAQPMSLVLGSKVLAA